MIRFITLAAIVSDYVASYDRKTGEWLGKNMEGSGCGLIEVITRNFLNWLIEQTKKPKSGKMVSRLRFELRTFQIQFSGVTLPRTDW